jgi:hypothetical protein
MRKNPMFKSLAFVGAWFAVDALICITSVAGWRVLTAILSAIMLVSMCFVFGYMYSQFERSMPLCQEKPIGDELAEPVILDKDLEAL